MWKQVFTYQRRLATTVLPVLAPARSTRASAANHRESINACQNDDPVIANSFHLSPALLSARIR
jgi:hypothetical protein